MTGGRVPHAYLLYIVLLLDVVNLNSYDAVAGESANFCTSIQYILNGVLQVQAWACVGMVKHELGAKLARKKGGRLHSPVSKSGKLGGGASNGMTYVELESKKRGLLVLVRQDETWQDAQRRNVFVAYAMRTGSYSRLRGRTFPVFG